MIITPPGVPGVVFGTRALGDGRNDAEVRAAISSRLGIPREWATITQVHGDRVVQVTEPGHHGEADGLVTEVPSLVMAIATADCLPVVIIGSSTRAVVHAGWRGVAAGIVPSAVGAMAMLGDRPRGAVIGPHIGPCCYEVGPEVVEAIGGHERRTRAGTVGVDLAAAVRSQLVGVDVDQVGGCTRDDASLASYREDGTPDRQVTLAWIPLD